MAGAKIILKELRAEFLTASSIPVILAIAIAYHETGGFDLPLALLTLAGAVFIHIGTNTANDYFDHLSGADAANREYVRPFTGGTRFIQEGLISPAAVLTISIIFFIAATIVGIFLFMARGPYIIVLGVTGLLLGIFYTAPPVNLASRGLGESAVAVGYGLICAGACFVQTGSISAAAILSSVPMALLTAGIIVINEFQDFRGDMESGKRTLVVRMGRRKAVYLYSAIMFSSFVTIAWGGMAGSMPRLSLIALLPVILAARGVIIAGRDFDEPAKLVPANVMTILCHLLTGLLLTVSFLAG